ncbi:MAG: alpha/beta hydrolase-fold protein [Massilibacteroides sp.]|nr:alpha/beta hydrolase-fold protein [Massilibacteroides sp.]MDD4115179.1 alpha/beta hydrolase-fold protein [Massilibacteroides sp.]MDD4659061.1 alpha/beta hydrolase-fold protein [Massilibacteroides sp.]
MLQFKKLFFLTMSAAILSVQAYALPLISPAEGQTRIDSMSSKILNVTRQYSVYLPKSYSIHTEKRYPVLYLLHGLYDNNKGWLEGGNLQYIANEIIDNDKACEMIIVVPDAGTVKDGYFNIEGWPYETFFFEEFIPFIEKKYRILGDKPHRAIAGYSMGGGGATVYALEHPDMFSSVYAMSALMTLPKRDRTTPPKQDGTPVKDPKMIEFGKSVLANDCIVLISFSDDTTLEKYRAIRWFVDCGDDDFLLDVNYSFYQEMKKAKVPCEFRVRDGGHDWKYWHSALQMALPFVSDSFGK